MDVIEDIEEYQTVPGIIILVLRVVVMIVFLVALRDTMAHEYTPERVDFFLHFGAASLVWFIYLPVFRQIYRVFGEFLSINQLIPLNHQQNKLTIISIC